MIEITLSPARLPQHFQPHQSHSGDYEIGWDETVPDRLGCSAIKSSWPWGEMQQDYLADKCAAPLGLCCSWGEI